MHIYLQMRLIKNRNNIQEKSEESKSVSLEEREEYMVNATRKRNKKDNALDVESKEREAELNERIKEKRLKKMIGRVMWMEIMKVCVKLNQF